jgi:hypothetical protein
VHDHDLVYSQLGHDHLISDVSGLQTELNSKAPLAHSHTIDAVAGLQADLDSRAFTSHTHSISNVSGLQVALDGKMDVGTPAEIIIQNGPYNLVTVHPLGGIENQQLATLKNLHGEGAFASLNVEPVAGVGGQVTASAKLFLSAPEVIISTSAEGDGGFGGIVPNNQRLKITNAGAWFINNTSFGNVGDVLTSQGGSASPIWAPPAPGGASTLIELTDVFERDVGYSPNDGEVLTYDVNANNGNGGWWNKPISLPTLNLFDLGDVAQNGYSGVSDGQVLTFDGLASSWVNKTLPVIPSVLNDLSDVDTDVALAPFVGQAVLGLEAGTWRQIDLPKRHKPLPFNTTSLPSAVAILGSALHHNLHYRSIATSAVTIEIPPDSNWVGSDEYFANYGSPVNPGPMPEGGSMLIGKHGSGDVTIVAGVGVTINTLDTLTIKKIHGKVTLIKVTTNVWDVEGNLAVV